MPYGYRIAETASEDATPRLRPDPVAAPVVRRIFNDYAEGRGLQVIAEALTSEGILCPSAYDRIRNPHFGGVAWSKGTVRAILVNTRYAEWGGMRSTLPGYEQLIDSDLFGRVQEVFARKRAVRDTSAAVERVYRLRGLLRCGHCNRAMQGSWNNGEAYYRCRFPEKYADANGICHPRNVYLRERRLLEPLLDWLSTTCSPEVGVGAGRTRRVVLANAVPDQRAGAAPQDLLAGGSAAADHVEIFGGLGLKLTYLSTDQSVRVKILNGPRNTTARGTIAL